MIYDLSNINDAERAINRLSKLTERGKMIELTEVQQPRTINQNSYWHAIVTLLGKELGYSLDEMKMLIKDQLEWMAYEKNGHRFYRSSADLDAHEFGQLIDHTREIGDQVGCYLPTPEEYKTNFYHILTLVK